MVHINILLAAFQTMLSNQDRVFADEACNSSLWMKATTFVKESSSKSLVLARHPHLRDQPNSTLTPSTIVFRLHQNDAILFYIIFLGKKKLGPYIFLFL